MGDRKFFVTIVAIFFVLLMGSPAYAVNITYGGFVADNSDADSIFWGYDDAVVLSEGINYAIDSFFVEFWNDGAPVPDLFFDFSDRKEPEGGNNFPHIYASSSGVPVGVEFATETFQLGTEDVTLNIFIDGADSSAETRFNIDASGGSRVSGFLNFTPVPEPGAIWLLGFGLIGLAGLRRRFRKSE